MVTWGGGRDRMRPIARCSGGGGLACPVPATHSVADVSFQACGQASIVALELSPSGARQRPVRRGKHPATQPRPTMEKEETP
nr:MAG TPA: hypothetical protein [Caudoviricetes sp.]